MDLNLSKPVLVALDNGLRMDWEYPICLHMRLHFLPLLYFSHFAKGFLIISVPKRDFSPLTRFQPFRLYSLSPFASFASLQLGL